MPIPVVMPSPRTTLARVLAPVLLALLLALPAAAAGAPTLAAPSKQVLRVGIGTLPTSLDPGLAAYESDVIVQDLLFPALYRSGGGSSGALVPWLAAKQPVVANGGLRYTVTLRAARWSDGRPVTAADVKLGFTRARKTSFYGGFFAPVRSVTALGARTVRFDLSTPVPWFGELLASSVVAPVPSHVIKAKGKRWTQLANLVTAGPFLVKTGRGRTELVLAPNRYWWGARRVKLREVQLLAVDAASVSPLFRGGRLDVALREGSIHPSALATWQDDPRFRQVATGQGQYLYLNTRAPALQHAAVRRGIALAVDRAAIAALTGATNEPLATIVPPGIRGASTVTGGDRLLAASGAADAARAASELAAGGWVPGTKLDLYYASDSGYGGKVATAIEAQLAPLGVDVVLRPTSGANVAKVGVGISPLRTDVAMVLQGWLPDYSDPQNFHQLFACMNVDAGLNTSNLCAPEYDAAFATAAASSGGARVSAHRAVEDLLTGPAALMPAVPLYVPTGNNLVQPWVRGFVQQVSGRTYLEQAAILSH
jgi:ABC-type oligopeptide transport system substrate-binding subunit